MIPAYFIRIDRIPLKPNGKLDRKALPAPQIEVRRENYAAPENEVQEKLCTAMAGVLKLEQMGIHDDFYELGGDSLKAIELVSSCDLPGLSTAEIFQGRTPSKIAELYEKAQAENAEGSPETRNAEAMKKAHPLTTEQQYVENPDAELTVGQIRAKLAEQAAEESGDGEHESLSGSGARGGQQSDLIKLGECVLAAKGLADGMKLLPGMMMPLTGAAHPLPGMMMPLAGAAHPLAKEVMPLATGHVPASITMVPNIVKPGIAGVKLVRKKKKAGHGFNVMFRRKR